MRAKYEYLYKYTVIGVASMIIGTIYMIKRVEDKLGMIKPSNRCK